MKAIISYLFTSFFSHKQTKKQLDYVLVLPFISTLLLFIYIFAGSFLGYQTSFVNYYNQASEYHAVLNEMFDSYSVITSSGNNIETNVVINTLIDGPDKDRFQVLGYDVVVDTRDRNTTYDDFEYYCVLNADNTVHISYDDYLLLDENNKNLYSFVVRNRGFYLDTVEHIEKYQTFIEAKAEDLSEYHKLVEKYNNQEISELVFSKELYLMYAKLYFPSSIFSLDYYGELPTLRTYYMDHYNRNGVSKKYIYIFEEHTFSVFNSNGMRINYIGYYSNNMNYSFNENKTENINHFIMDTFYSGTTQRISNFLFSSFLCWFISFILLVVLCFIYRAISRNRGYENGIYFNNNIKIIGSFINVSSLFTAILAFALSFVLSRNIVFFISIGVISLTLIIRTIIFYEKEFSINRKTRNNRNRFIPQ